MMMGTNGLLVFSDSNSSIKLLSKSILFIATMQIIAYSQSCILSSIKSNKIFHIFNTRTQNNLAKHIKIGKLGESMAVHHLMQMGYKILEENWRYGRNEIDIIAENQKGTLVFIEVKTRTSDAFGMPDEQITEAQVSRISNTAAFYMSKNHYSWEFRFDVISILLTKNLKVQSFQHKEDAFFPGVL